MFSANSGTRVMTASLRILYSLLQPIDIMHSLRVKLSLVTSRAALRMPRKFIPHIYLAIIAYN
jgi:hypothetical protein